MHWLRFYSEAVRPFQIIRLCSNSPECVETRDQMKKQLLALLLVMSAATGAMGKSTKLVASWKNPDYSGPAFHRILVLGMSAKPGVRADFEDALSKLVAHNGVEAIAGNTILLRPEGTKL